MACTNAESAQLVSCNEVGEPAAGRHSRLSRLLAAAPVLASFLSTSAAGGESTFWLDLLPNTIETIKAMATEGDRLAKRSVCDEEKSAGPSAVKAPAKCVFNTRTKALVVQSLQPPGVPTASGGGTDISPDGTCVVGHQDNGFFTRFHAFRWTQATGPVDLGTLDPPNNANRSSSATAVSSDCTVVTGFSDVAGGFTQ
ncbi:MAG: hypothetical protein ACXWVP_06960, partial [Burkholderiales bacterium]